MMILIEDPAYDFNQIQYFLEVRFVLDYLLLFFLYLGALFWVDVSIMVIFLCCLSKLLLLIGLIFTLFASYNEEKEFKQRAFSFTNSFFTFFEF